jgi:uncharacterized repeat protein (TIGR03803 family)
MFQPAFRTNTTAMTAGILLIGLISFGAAPAQAQAFTVLHSFTGGSDGKIPYAGLTMDRAGNLYGTTAYGGFTGNDCGQAGNVGGCGTIFRLTREGSGWAFNSLYQFQGFPSGDGAQPWGRVIIGPDGNLYGTTLYGGLTGPDCVGSFEVGCGTVFKLTPPATFCRNVLCSWNETRLYSFAGEPDGAGPEGEIAFDAAGNLYGATNSGGAYSPWGTLFELTPAYGAWQETVLYNFMQRLDGGGPRGGVAVDPAGNVYGTTWIGGAGDFGTIFQLASSGSGWTLNTLYSYGTGNGFGSYAGVIIDAAGNLYGATVNGDPNGDAYVYELSPSNGGWIYNTLYIFPQCYGCGPAANLVMDAAGNLYGTTRGLAETGNPWGNVFKLTPSNGGWIYTDLHDFTGGSDGGVPYSSLVLDSNGNLYGTTTAGGQYGVGVVFEITP